MEDQKTLRPRRARGEGSLYRNKDGRWVISLVVGHRLVPRQNPDGTAAKPKKVARRKRVFCKSKGDAAAKLRRLLTTYNPDFAGDLILADFLDDFLEDGVDRWRPATYNNYETWARRHVCPYLGSKRVCEITADDVRNWQRELSERHVPIYTRVRAHKFMISAFNQLMLDRRVSWNPFKAVKPSRPPRADVYVPSPDELNRLIAACPDEQVRAMVVLAATTMLRIGEILALRLQDIDFEKARVSVTATLSQDWDGTYRRGEPKTESSRRVLTLPEAAIDALRSHLKARRLMGMRRTQWVFSNSDGSPIERHNYRTRIWLPLLKVAKLPANMHFHALRHAGNSLLLDAGVPVLVVAARCGHADTRMTMDRYGHVIRAGADKEAAAVTDKIFDSILPDRQRTP